MNKIQVFKSEQFGAIRTMVMPDGQIGFVGKDVAEALGYSNASKAIIMHVDDEDKVELQVYLDSQNGNAGQRRKATFISESGLYSLILASKLPAARQFKRWVTSEVLPQIRRTGGYLPVSAEEDDQTIISKAMQILQRTLEQKDEQLAEQKPKVQFAEQISGTPGGITITEMAKLLCENGFETGRLRFYKWLRDHHFIFQRSTEPIQEWVERGIFEVKATLIESAHGRLHESITPVVTPRGQEYFLQLLCGGEAA